MKKFIFGLVFSLIVPGYCLAGATELAVSEAEKIKAYEMGIQAAREAERNRQLWQEGKGDPEMAKQYQEGLKFAKKAKAEHERLYHQAEKNLDQAENDF